MFKIERQNALKPALHSMFRVIYALILREVKVRYGPLKIGFLWGLIEPILFVGVLSIIFYIRRDSVVYGMPLLVFLLTGIIPFLLFRNTMSRTLTGAQQNKALLHFPQINPFEIVVARSILEFVVVLIAFTILCILMDISGLAEIDIEEPIKLLIILMTMSLLGFAVGTGIGAWIPLFPLVERIATIFISRPLFFLSGVFFTIEMIPVAFREYLLWNPLFHLVEMFRSYFFISFESNYTDPAYVASCTLILLFIALATQRALRRYVIQL